METEGNVFIKALKDTFLKGPIKFIFGSISSIGFVFLLGKNVFKLDLLPSIGLGFIALFCFFTVVYLCFLSKHLYNYSIIKWKESYYGDILVILKDILAQVNSLKKPNMLADDKFIATMSYVCQQLKLIYTKKGNKESIYSVSIKVAIGSDISSQTEVKNLCRDKNSSQRDTDTYNSIRHFIFQNTCYNYILTRLTSGKKIAYYLNNKISKTDNYCNTSKESYGEKGLPYESELVVPIVPMNKENENNYPVLGFICIDCSKGEAFNNKYDLAIFQIIADNIYDVIQLRNMQKQQILEQNEVIRNV